MTSLNQSPRQSNLHHPQSYPSTPPYSSADEMRAAQPRPMMMPRPSYPTYYSPSSTPYPSQTWMDPRLLSGTSGDYSPAPYPTPDPSAFSFYPTPYPANPCIPQSFPVTSPDEIPMAKPEPEGQPEKFRPQSEDSAASKMVKPPPRPPNAWIIYRSDMLRAIGKGEHPPGLDAAMAEAGVSSEEGPGEDGSASSDHADNGVKVKPKRIKKPKKGSKEPSAGMLTLGKGKTGRGIPQADVSKLISLMWAREDPVIKKQYEKQSQIQKEEHQRKYPDYKFQPLKRADKLKLREERDREKAEAKLQKLAEKRAEKQASGRESAPGRADE